LQSFTIRVVVWLSLVVQVDYLELHAPALVDPAWQKLVGVVGEWPGQYYSVEVSLL
jgi:hypothetical protein